jgi:hypothetical protein
LKYMNAAIAEISDLLMRSHTNHLVPYLEIINERSSGDAWLFSVKVGTPFQITSSIADARVTDP